MKYHNLTPEMVKAEIEHKCARLEQLRLKCIEASRQTLARYIETPHLFTKKPDPEGIDVLYHNMIGEQRTCYALVRLGHLKSGWWLRYDKERKDGTGPFATRKKAANWFLTGGR